MNFGHPQGYNNVDNDDAATAADHDDDDVAIHSLSADEYLRLWPSSAIVIIMAAYLQ